MGPQSEIRFDVVNPAVDRITNAKDVGFSAIKADFRVKVPSVASVLNSCSDASGAQIASCFSKVDHIFRYVSLHILGNG